MSLVMTKDDLEDTEKEAADTEKFAGALKEQCATKEKEWAEQEKTRSEEIAAISDAIGILNDDDALDVFKKAIPSALIQQGPTAFLQRSGAHTKASRVRKAQALLEGIKQTTSHKGLLKLMLFSLSSKLRLHTKQHTGLSAGKFE